MPNIAHAPQKRNEPTPEARALYRSLFPPPALTLTKRPLTDPEKAEVVMTVLFNHFGPVLIDRAYRRTRRAALEVSP